MARIDGDSWDITESVGATALGVAAGRAAETRSEHPLISDPYAEVFLEAAGEGMWSVYLREDLPAELEEVDPRFKERMDAMMGYTASRTLFFDDFFMAAAVDGVKQAVILAAGLDASAMVNSLAHLRHLTVLPRNFSGTVPLWPQLGHLVSITTVKLAPASWRSSFAPGRMRVRSPSMIGPTRTASAPISGR